MSNQASMLSVFGGYNHNIRIPDSDFFDMQNMTSDDYPVLSSRKSRGGEVPSMVGSAYSKGIIYRDELYYIVTEIVDNQVALCHRVDTREVTVAQWESADSTSTRTIIPMGAYLVILPDKKYVNLADLGAASTSAKNIENTRTTSGTATIQPCLSDGTVLSIDYVGDTVPEDIRDEFVWLDTKSAPSLKKYYASNGMWQSVVSTTVKISGTGISNGFEVDDGVLINGIEASELSDLNAKSIIKAKPDNNSLVLTGVVNYIPENGVLVSLEGLTCLDGFLSTNNGTTSATTVHFLCDSTIEENQFLDKRFKIAGEKEVICRGNLAAARASYYVIDDDGFKVTVNNQSTDTDVLAMASSENDQKGSVVYLANNFIPKNNSAYQASWSYYYDLVLTDNKLAGRRIRIGENGAEAIIRRSGVISANSEHNPTGTVLYYIELNISVEVPAGTILYPIKSFTSDNEYMVTVTLEDTDGMRIKRGDKAVIALADQYSQSAAITVSRTMPDMDFVIESQNRLWGCKYGKVGDKTVNEIYASVPGDEGFKNWNRFEGIASDSYAASVGTDGEWTGAINYLGDPIFFKEHYIHRVYGNYPSQYTIPDTRARGVQKGSSASLAMVNEVLYYKGLHGICAYNGGLPAEISSALGDVSYKDAVACAFKGKYYVCMKDASGNPAFFVYDTTKQMWHKEDDLYVSAFCATDDNILYLLPDTSGIYALFGDAESAIPWSVESGILGLEIVGAKYPKTLNIRSIVDGVMQIWIEYDSTGEWELITTISDHPLHNDLVKIPPHRCDHYRLKITGTGGVKVFSITTEYDQGSEQR